MSLLVLDAAGALVGEPVVVTTRAFPDGGVALAPMEGGGAVLAWVALENGDPRVHVGLVDATGKRGSVVTLATAKGAAASVALAPVDDGVVAAWVDGRDGNGEVYAVHLTRDLRRGPEERITNAPGDAADITLLNHRGVVWAAWSDAREAAAEGLADIFVTRLSAKAAKRMGDDVRVQATAAHSRSPSLAAAGDALLLGWIEEAPTAVDATSSGSYGAMLAWLDGRGRPVESPQRFGGASVGAPSTFVLSGAGAGVRALLARSAPGSLVLDAALIGADPEPPRFSPLFTLDGPPTLDAPMTINGDTALFTDVGSAPGERRARRVTVEWHR